MKKKVYTILDKKGKSIGPLVMAVDRDDIIRSVIDALRGDSLMSRYPEDFVLLEIGSIEIETGVFLYPPESPIEVCCLDDLKGAYRASEVTNPKGE